MALSAQMIVVKEVVQGPGTIPGCGRVRLHIQFPEDDAWVEVFRHFSDDLPAHILRPAYWNTSPTNRHRGYRCIVGQKVYLFEFINDAWYFIEQHFDADLEQHIFHTRNSLRIDHENDLGLGWWLPEDKENPERLPPMTVPVPVEERSIEKEPLEHPEEDVTFTYPSDPVEELTEAFRHLTPIHTDLALVEPITPTETPVVPVPFAPSMSPPAPMATVPLSGALKGTTPTVFTGERAESAQFLWEFHLYHLLNRNHELVQNPFL
ncbi:hypothetical protein EDB92DRAFT_1949678 [Lactarius akahatsu]|uniref:Uncharacterized protein n=1 Tax=Lactarius akahatsu TaxID=416441 RepID=A0AAD4QAP0_9AGAM|nr:hypothetical protein EDB92DRAFT_1949678 [Lactarius akahatsu]